MRRVLCDALTARLARVLINLHHYLSPRMLVKASRKSRFSSPHLRRSSANPGTGPPPTFPYAIFNRFTPISSPRIL
jgi:hypothetical protein